MTPIRVEWTVPDEARREAARAMVQRDRERHADRSYGADHALAATRSEDELVAVWLQRYPDLEAVTTHFGHMISLVHVPAQYAARTFERQGLDLGTVGIAPFKLSEARWVALIATEAGIVEMDPRVLRVPGLPNVSGPVGGTLSRVALADREERNRKNGLQAERFDALKR